MNLEAVAATVLPVIVGVLATLLGQRVFGKRGLFTYFVWHNRVGVSADDLIFGQVRVTWNGAPVANLYSSTLELRNESLTDYDNVVVRIFTNDTRLLTERSDLLGTARILQWTPDFARRLAVAEGAIPTEAQWTLYWREREYLIPTLNRGQVVRVTFLNTTAGEIQPSIWLDIVHKGVNVKFRIAHDQFLGVPRPAAVLAGAVLGVPFVLAVAGLVHVVWAASVASFLYGLLVIVPGAISMKMWRSFREIVGG